MYRCVITILILFWGLISMSRADDTQLIQQKIDGLADPDPAVRSKCFDELKAMGDRIRPQLTDAIHSTSPAISDAAISLISQLPWYVKDDSPKAKTLLGKYGELDGTNKRDILITLLNSSNPKDTQTLIRILSLESDNNFVWAMVNSYDFLFHPAFRKYVTDNDITQLPLSIKNSAANVLLSVDYPRGVKALLEVVKEAKTTPQKPEYGFIPVAKLVKEAELSHDWINALNYQRLQGEWTDDTMKFARAILIHAKHGPFPGLKQDISALNGKLELYAFSHLLSRIGCALPSQIIASNALAKQETQVMPDAQEWNLQVAQFLYEQELPGLALLELDQSHGNTDNTIPYLRYCCLLANNSLSEAADVLDGLAEQLKSPLHFDLGDGGDIEMTADDCRAKAQWLRVQFAQQHSSTAETDKQLSKLIALAPEFDEVTLELVAILDERQRTEDANDVFNRTFERALAKTSLTDETPRRVALSHNNLAWLCARCNRKLDIALKHALIAVNAEPNAAFLDTLAEVYFRMGNFDKAVEIETKALQLSPREPSIPEQLQRFKDAAIAKKSGHSTTAP